jgi:hypothetical protein
MNKRTDIHSIKNLVPSEYDFVMAFSYSEVSGPDGYSEPVWPESITDVCNFVREHGSDMANIHKGHLKCDHCGSNYLNGEVWRHQETNQFITIGHICGDKLNMARDLSKHEYILKMKKKATKQRILAFHKRVENRKRIRHMLETTKGLSDALKVDHYITKGMRKNFCMWGRLTERQLELLFKLKREAHVVKTSDNWIKIPEVMFDGRQAVTGIVLSTKHVESHFGVQTKMLVKVDSDSGSWKAWGTCPSAIDSRWDEDNNHIDPTGSTVTFFAKFSPSNTDKSFCFFNRPTKAKVVK